MPISCPNHPRIWKSQTHYQLHAQLECQTRPGHRYHRLCVDPFLETYNLTVQYKPSSLTSNANLTKFQPMLNWTYNNRSFPAFSIPYPIPAWLTPSPLQWITTHMNTAFPSIPLWVHRLPKKIGHRESFEGDSDKRAEDTWTSNYQKFPPWWSFSSRTPTSQ